MRGLVIAMLLVPAIAAATPWGDRCKARLAKVAPALGSIGKATITIAPPPVQKTGPYELKNLDPFGELSLVIKTGNRTYTATIGEDHSGHRHRGMRGLESTRYEEWHSPYVDSIDGEPDGSVALREEFHHKVAVGSVRAELRVDVAPTKTGPRAPKSRATSDPTDKQFADSLRPVLAACWADVRPDEADPSLSWTTKCLADLTAAHAALVKVEPVFGNGTCKREPFGASCGHVEGAQPTWNALTTLVGGGTPTLAWTADGTNRKSYASGGALIWGSDKLPAAQYAKLFAAFEKPLERCSQLLRTNMYP